MGVRDENSLRSAPKKPSRSAAFVRRLKPAERSPFEFASKGAARTSNQSQVEERALPGSGTTTLVSPLPSGVEAVKAPCELIHCTSNFRSQTITERSGERLFMDLERVPRVRLEIVASARQRRKFGSRTQQEDRSHNDTVGRSCKSQCAQSIRLGQGRRKQASSRGAH